MIRAARQARRPPTQAIRFISLAPRGQTMRTRTIAASMLVAAALTTTPMLAPAAMAQPVSMTSASTIVPVVLWAATGAVIGAVAWPVVAGGAAAAAAGSAG